MIFHSHTDYDVCFYGNDWNLDKLRAKYSDPLFLKQVHSDKLVEASQDLKEADAHYTSKAQTTLVIQTADCLPVMIYLPLMDTAIGIHAGWRGVEQRIVTKSLQQLAVDKNDPIHVYIGPHIQKSSFEVDLDVATKIMSAHGLSTDDALCEQRGSKYYIDLSSLVLREIKNLSLNIDLLFVSEVDTKTDPRYFSFRNGDRGGRNYSVITKK